MSININGYNPISSYHEGKKGYLNKFEKSLKLPFLSALHNHLPNSKVNEANESKIDDSDIKVSDTVELSSAVVGASALTE